MVLKALGTKIAIGALLPGVSPADLYNALCRRHITELNSTRERRDP